MKKTENKNFSTAFTTNQSPATVFAAIQNVRGWWSENIEGHTAKLHDVFLYWYKDVHRCKIEITEVIANRRIVWRVLENQFNFTRDPSEWKGNRMIFDISETEGRTQLTFTQEGLVPAYECYSVCHDAWTNYIQGSLQSLIATGKGKPNTRENDLNMELVEKWGLPDK
ncbi:MAG: SRPBCC domain-containing protein [Bacteroidetes bacterium]|nr:SRPBCC domain-containing protein [Bacteroidota bacterium]